MHDAFLVALLTHQQCNKKCNNVEMSNKDIDRASGVVQVVEHLPSKSEALRSNSSAAKKILLTYRLIIVYLLYRII
jgi:hypothetical protein